MKVLIAVFAVLVSSQAHAAGAKVECRIAYTSSSGSAINSLESVELQPFSSKRIEVGTLALEVGIGSDTTLSSGETSAAVSVAIFDKRYLTAQVGDISADPRIPAKASYQVADDRESLSASCRKVN